ncbi:DNA topology modulation protein FlaR [Virgibacillus doumboii]|uniref:DNA topology modulation protein FlaR n=1 Tax=Virgibacillus doumboii TaxID=2697503 RepID=UPI0013DFE7E9|nr:DNA topology modulation protein FlaR [Virgibacillus doumboii]
MNEAVPRKIHIIGSVGSGKTTMAKRLSGEQNIPFYELDNVVWIRNENGDIRRTPDERNAYLQHIILQDAWIVEGVHNEEWVNKSFENADVIYFIDTAVSVRTYRIIKRFILQKLGLEKANYQLTFKIFFKMFKWNKTFEKHKPAILQRLELYGDKLVILRDNIRRDHDE